MSGHSKWANIKRRKGAVDAKRGKTFTKLIKEITVAARMGGGDITGNPRLKTAVAAAKAENMPKDNIDRAIKKGTGELEGVVYDEITYEGYGPGGVAVMVECMTDNRVRTVADVRHAFAKSGGNLGESGCVGYMFDHKGLLVVDKASIDEEKLLELALDAGAEDVVVEEGEFQVTCTAEEFSEVQESLTTAGVSFVEAKVSMIPKIVVDIKDEKVARQILTMIERLEDHDDVQNVHANFDIPDDLMEAISS